MISNLSSAKFTLQLTSDISNHAEISCSTVLKRSNTSQKPTSPLPGSGKMVSLEEAFYTNNSFLGPNVDLEGKKEQQIVAVFNC